MIDQMLERYLTQTVPEKSEQTVSLEAYALDHHVPIMEPLGIEFLLQMIRIKQPKRILEIGTAIGYSAIRMAHAFQESQVITIERDPIRYKEAITHIEEAGLSDRIDVILGDALNVQEEIEEYGPFDILFIDAAKGQYQNFFEIYTQFIVEDGLVISDNVLFKGYVAEEKKDDTRKEKVGQKIRSYNDWLVNHKGYYTVIVPLGDGVALSVKRGNK